MREIEPNKGKQHDGRKENREEKLCERRILLQAITICNYGPSIDAVTYPFSKSRQAKYLWYLHSHLCYFSEGEKSFSCIFFHRSRHWLWSIWPNKEELHLFFLTTLMFSNFPPVQENIKSSTLITPKTSSQNVFADLKANMSHWKEME